MQPDDRRHPVAYASRALSAPEKNYSITELETFAVVWAVHAYLYGHEVLVITDHSAVKAMLETPSPSGKHAWWWTKVFGSRVKHLQIKHRPGRENTGADALSWNPLASTPEKPTDGEVQIAQVKASDLNDISMSQLLDMPPAKNDATCLTCCMDKEQEKNPDISFMIKFLETGVLPDNKHLAKKIAAQASVCCDRWNSVFPWCKAWKSPPSCCSKTIKREDYAGKSQWSDGRSFFWQQIV